MMEEFRNGNGIDMSASNGSDASSEIGNSTDLTSSAKDNNKNEEFQISSTTTDTAFRFSESVNLEDIRELQSEFVKERNWDQYHQPRNLVLAMMGEVGEVAELFQWKGEVQEGCPNWTAQEKDHLAQELSDVLIYLVRLAEKCHVDLPTAALEKIALNKQKYPAEKTWGSSKKYNEYL